MKHFILTACLLFLSLAMMAQETMWVKHENRFKANEAISLADKDSALFTSTMLRTYQDGRATFNKAYSAIMDFSVANDSSAAIVFENPGLILWKPLTSDNDYNNDYYNTNSRWTIERSLESEHFVVFWDKAFGSNPNATSVPEALRVDVRDLLAKAEQFYETNVSHLGMATVGENHSQLDTYKMSIYLIYQTEWLATGSGYDDVIGALWVNPSTCKPVGHTIAHEIGHSFQFQVAADYRKNGDANYLDHGFRYGFGDNGAGGNAFWEQCAQWQGFQDYAAETFGYHVGVWLSNYHRHFHHEWMRYASYWYPYVWIQKHGSEAYGRIWRESQKPDDALQTYIRLFCNGNLDAFWDEYWRDYACQLPNYQFPAIHQYATASAKNFPMSMFLTEDGYWQVAYASCPETSGVNIIQLQVPQAGTTVKADFVGLTPGSPLHAEDPGHALTSDDGSKYNVVTTYNTAGTDANKGWRYGFVAVGNDQTSISEMAKDAEGTATYAVPEGTQKLYFVVIGAPTTYNRHAWDETDANDVQWPYKVRFEGSNRLGYYEFDDDAVPCDTTVAYTVTADGNADAYELGSIGMMSEGLLDAVAKAFKLQAADIAANFLPIAAGTTVTPKEGKVCLAMKSPTSKTYSYSYTANAGFWCSASGAAQSYGSAPVYVEYQPSTFTLVYGHMPKTGKGRTYTMRPTFVYVKNNKRYYATIELTLKL